MEENLVSIFMRQVSERGRRTALIRKAGGKYIDITWDEFGKAVQSLAGALVDMGVRKGDRIAVLATHHDRPAVRGRGDPPPSPPPRRTARSPGAAAKPGPLRSAA